MTEEQKQKLQEINCQYSGLYSIAKESGNQYVFAAVVQLGKSICDYSDMMKEQK